MTVKEKGIVFTTIGCTRKEISLGILCKIRIKSPHLLQLIRRIVCEEDRVYNEDDLRRG